MRRTVKEQINQSVSNHLFHVDFHSFIERESVLRDTEIARELGISIRDVKFLKKKYRN